MSTEPPLWASPSVSPTRLTLGRVGATGVACAYVAAVRLASGCKRDNIETMRRRFVALTVTCAVAWIPTAWLMFAFDVGGDDDDVVVGAGTSGPLTLRRALGLDANRVLDARACALGALVGIALTLGALVDGATSPNGRLKENLRRIAKPRTRAEAMMNWRDFAHAPACEEFCFRACASSALRVAGASPIEQVALTAALFALAHARPVNPVVEDVLTGLFRRYHHQIFEHRHLGEFMRDLKRAHDAAMKHLVGWQTGNILAGIHDAPGAGFQLAGDHVEQRGLARAIGTDEAGDGAFGDL